jgi:hypothetical protein
LEIAGVTIIFVGGFLQFQLAVLFLVIIGLFRTLDQAAR